MINAKRYYLFISMLLVLIIYLQYDLWFAKHGINDLKNLKKNIVTQNISIDILNKKNLYVYKKILALRDNNDYIEGLARQDLGLVKKNEVFYMFKKTNIE